MLCPAHMDSSQSDALNGTENSRVELQRCLSHDVHVGGPPKFSHSFTTNDGPVASGLEFPDLTNAFFRS